MVRYVWKTDARGQRLWTEVAPQTCPDGHTRLSPGWGGCPDCNEVGRTWTCWADGCGHRLFDYDHQCKNQGGSVGTSG
jgi:hypothetical protein